MSRKTNIDSVDSLSNLFPHFETFKLGPSKMNVDSVDSWFQPSQKFEFRYMSQKTNVDNGDSLSYLFLHSRALKLDILK